MEKPDFNIPHLQIVNFKADRNCVAFGAPESVVRPTTYTDFEMNRFLGFDLSTQINDVETSQNYLLLKRNIDNIEIPEVFDEAETILNQTISRIMEITNGDALQPLPTGNYWRFLIGFQGISRLDLHEIIFKIKQGPNPHGPHATLVHRPEQSVLRVKAETLSQLEDLFGEAKTKLV